MRSYPKAPYSKGTELIGRINGQTTVFQRYHIKNMVLERIMRLHKIGVVMGGLLLIFAGMALAAETQTPEAEKVPQVSFAENRWEFEPVVAGSEVTHDFIVQNAGNAPLKITRVKTG